MFGLKFFDCFIICLFIMKRREKQSDFQSGVDKQKNQLTLDLMGQNLALCQARSGSSFSI